MTEIPRSHPRYESLMTREKITDGVKSGITSPAGLIAQGRGEAFDYLIGERTCAPAKTSTRAAAAMLLLAKRPVLSINGNTATLVPREIVILARLINAPIEINLFYRTEERVQRIADLLRRCGAQKVLGEHPDAEIPGIDHQRAKACRGGIYDADVVLVPLEDGDRCEALVRMGKKVITVDLNPLSRTAKMATITIVDNVVRTMPHLISVINELAGGPEETLLEIVKSYDNIKMLREILLEICVNIKDGC